MTPQEILTAARALISEPARWTQGEYARSAKGRRVNYNGPKAVCWCVAGAIMRAGVIKKESILPKSIVAVLRMAIDNWINVTEWNDYPHRTHAEVLAMLDRAIALAGESA